MRNRTLRELLRGKRAHADPVACVEDLSLALAGQRVDGYPHSIFQIVGHLNYWMDYEIHRMAGEPALYPQHAIESWPPSAAPENEEQWRAAIARFGWLLGKLEELSGAGEDVLDRVVRVNHPAQESESSVEAVLWQTLVHNSYHIGQVALLRRCLGAWPPRRGGDTW
ncbi:MAG: DinB family protein [Terriglobales bacterium]